MQSETSNHLFLTAAGRRRLEQRIVALEHTVAELRTAIEDPESRTESVGAYLGALRERDSLRTLVRDAELIDDAFDDDPDVVEIGDRVIIRLVDGTAERYILVHPAEAAAGRGRLSIESPLGRALLSRRVGETVSVVAPGTSYDCRILTADRPGA